jgi:hypothetical protein
MSSPRYAEIQVTSHFSFLRGASSCEELFAQAALLGIEALAIVDRNSLAGVVRAHEAAKTTGIRLIVGCRLDLADGASVLVYPTDRRAYARLCRLLSLDKRRAGKAKCHLEWSDLAAYGEGLIAVLVPDIADELCGLRLRRLHETFGDRAYMALTLRRRPNDQLRLWELSKLATQMRVATWALPRRLTRPRYSLPRMIQASSRASNYSSMAAGHKSDRGHGGQFVRGKRVHKIAPNIGVLMSTPPVLGTPFRPEIKDMRSNHLPAFAFVA